MAWTVSSSSALSSWPAGMVAFARAACEPRWTRAPCGAQAGSSLKAALDLDWDDPAKRQQALEWVLVALEAVDR
jgi:hypothetical protein